MENQTVVETKPLPVPESIGWRFFYAGVQTDGQSRFVPDFHLLRQHYIVRLLPLVRCLHHNDGLP